MILGNFLKDFDTPLRKITPHRPDNSLVNLFFKAEIGTVLQLGGDPSRIVLSHTRKQPSTLKYAVTKDINLTIFDDEQELMKIKQIHPNARYVCTFLVGV